MRAARSGAAIGRDRDIRVRARGTHRGARLAHADAASSGRAGDGSIETVDFLVVVGDAPKAPWDQRLTERLARQSWAAANDPARRRRNPSFWAQIRSPYYWFAVLALGGASVTWLAATSHWLHAVGASLYVVSLLASALARRDARNAGSRSSPMEENDPPRAVR